MKRGCVAVLLLLITSSLFAQKNQWVNVKLNTRFDYQREYLDGKMMKSNSGFEGKYLNLQMNGQLTDELSYSFHHRLNKMHSDQSFFDATDWLYLNYTKNNWVLSAGKQVVGIGGYEYDRAPIDLYFCSEFWNNIPCYEWGVSATYVLNEGKDKIVAQICQSPFQTEDDDAYAYNLMWYGSHGWFSSIYSVNLMECMPGHFIHYIALGNKFTMNQVALELDVMNRSSEGHAFWGKDVSIMGELAWNLNRFKCFGKVTYDVNQNNPLDACVALHSELTRFGGGVEYFPLKDDKKTLRLHATCSFVSGRNGNPASAMQDKHAFFNVGLSWSMDVLNLKK